MRTVISMLHDAAARYPDRTYATKKSDEGWKHWSFSDIDRDSDVTAAALISLGIPQHSSAALLAEGRPEWISAEFGILKAACTSVPLSIKLTSEEFVFRLNHAEVKAFFISSNTLSKVQDAWPSVEHPPLLILLDPEHETLRKSAEAMGLVIGKDIITWDQLIEEGRKRLSKEPSLISDRESTIDEHDTVNICYTSGTTGNPKGIMLTHLNYWANAHDAVQLCNIPDRTFETLVMLPLDHSFAHTVGLYASLLRGITLHFVDARGSSMNIIRNIPKNLLETNPVYLMTVPALSGNFMKKIISGVAQKGSLINGIFTSGVRAGIRINGDGFKEPSLWTRAVNYLPWKLASLLVFPKVRSIFGSRLQFCIGGGALLEIRQQQFFAAIGVPIFQGYGLTEAAPIICSNSPKRHKFGTSGMVAPSVTCRIMKSRTEEAAAGERGEIVIQGSNVMKGYYKNPEATKEVLKDGWLWTGDLGYFDEDGFLFVTGRAKALLIAPDGEKYSPEEVEEAVINHAELVHQIMVFNDHQVITGALVTLNSERLRQLLKAKGISSPEDVLKVIKEDILRFAAAEPGRIPAQWVPGLIEIIPHEFSEADGLINSTMKLVRHRVTEHYQDRIHAMYQDRSYMNGRNRTAVKKLLNLR